MSLITGSKTHLCCTFLDSFFVFFCPEFWAAEIVSSVWLPLIVICWFVRLSLLRLLSLLLLLLLLPCSSHKLLLLLLLLLAHNMFLIMASDFLSKSENPKGNSRGNAAAQLPLKIKQIFATYLICRESAAVGSRQSAAACIEFPASWQLYELETAPVLRSHTNANQIVLIDGRRAATLHCISIQQKEKEEEKEE